MVELSTGVLASVATSRPAAEVLPFVVCIAAVEGSAAEEGS